MAVRLFALLWIPIIKNRNRITTRETRCPLVLLTSLAVMLLSYSAVAVARNAAPAPQPEMQSKLLASFAALKNHIQGQTKLNAEQMDALKQTVDQGSDIFGRNDAIIKAALDLVSTYDDTWGPLWIAHGPFNRRSKPPVNDIHWTIYNVMQNIMDHVYTTENIARYGDLLEGYKFGSSAHFPGSVAPPANPQQTYRVKIDASYVKPFKHVIMHQKRPARRPTGAIPGTGDHRHRRGSAVNR